MSKFIKNTFLFILAFFLFDKVLFVFIALAPKLEADKRLEQVITGEMNKDFIILGSSRGARNVIAGQIEDSLRMSSYNLSYPGSNIEFHEFILRSLIQFNDNPKKVLLVVDDPREFLPSDLLTFRLERLYPLAKYKHINDEMIARGEKNLSSKILVLSRMNLKNLDIRKKHFSALDTIVDCGSMPISTQRENMIFSFDSTVIVYQKKREIESKISAFLKLQDLCIENNIELVLVFCPNFKALSNSFEKRLRKLTNENVKYMLYDTLNPIYQDESYYYDYIHLKKNGAVAFTNEIIKFFQINDSKRSAVIEPRK